MNIQRLKYFCAVAQTEHISRAAQKLHIAQPALSKAITLLEEELGVTLFERSGRHIRLNENGREFLKYAETAIVALEDGRNTLRRMNQVMPSRIRLQTNVTHDRYLIELMRSFREAYPQVNFEVIKNYIKSKFIYDCDIYIHGDSIHLNKCHFQPLFTEKIMLGVPVTHPLAQAKTINLADVASAPFITLDKSASWVDETEAICLEAGFTPRYRYLCDGTEMIAKLIAAGEGIGFLPEISWGHFPADVALLTLECVPRLRHYNLSWPVSKHDDALVTAFREHCQHFFLNMPTEEAK